MVGVNGYRVLQAWVITFKGALQSVGLRSDTGQIPCNRLTCQPKLAHDRSFCPFISGTRVRFCGELFFFFPLFFFFSPSLSPRLAFLFFPSFFCPPLISSSPFPLPSFLFFFQLFFSHSFSFFFTSCFPLSAAFLSLFPPFILFS